jgi:hypothetical protein
MQIYCEVTVKIMANIKNLKPFKKGEDERRNTLGRPKKTLLSEAIREQLSEAMPNAPERTVAEAIARTLIREAISGNVQAIREIGDRTEGKPKQAIDLDLDLQLDWRIQAQKYGLLQSDIIAEAQLLIAESLTDSSDE